MAKRSKRVSTSHVGKAIKLAIKQLKAARATSGTRGKKHIDLNVKVLALAHKRIMMACSRSANPWVVPGG